jgi:tRNA(fMet)-specific endonuclease VapC
VFCTNAVIAVLNERIPRATERLDAEIFRGTTILLSTIVLHELRYGVAKSARPERSEAILESFLELPLTIAAFEAEEGLHAGDIRTGLAKLGTPIASYEELIAAQGRRRGAALVTFNRREFERAPGLIVTDWAA